MGSNPLEGFEKRINYLPRSDPHHVLKELNFKGGYNFSTACTDWLQELYMQFLTVKKGWNFTNPSKWFLDSIKDFVEFVPELLYSLQLRSVLPFIKSFRYTGTYYGFELLCIGIFGESVVILYENTAEKPYTITISGISSPISYKILGEGEQDFFLVTEDLSSYIKTEDVFLPPTGLWVIEEILRKNLPAGLSDIATIIFTSE